MELHLGLHLRQQQKLTLQQRLLMNCLAWTQRELDQKVRDEWEQNPCLQLEDPWAESPSPLRWDGYQQWAACAQPYPDKQLVAPKTLADVLCEQFHELTLSQTEQGIIEFLIGNLNEFGYLEDLALEEVATLYDVSLETVRGCVQQLQGLDPPGVGAMTDRECALIQLRRADGVAIPEPIRSLLVAMLDQYYEALGNRRYATIAQALGVTCATVKTAKTYLSRLQLRPGLLFVQHDNYPITPDVIVVKKYEKWAVESVREASPYVRLNPEIEARWKQGSFTAAEQTALRHQRRQAKELITLLESRVCTIQRVAARIMTFQHAFLEHGTSHLRPLTMAQVADDLGYAESTVSRAVKHKYAWIAKYEQLYPLKFFFQKGLPQAGAVDKNISVSVVRDLIATIVAAESPSRPLSDRAIAERLGQRGITIARKTVQHYREMLGIPSSRQRKRRTG